MSLISTDFADTEAMVSYIKTKQKKDCSDMKREKKK